MSASLQAGARKKKHKICLKKSQKILNLTQIIRTLDVPALTEILPQDPSPCPLYIVLWPLNVLVHKPDYPKNPPSIFESLKKELTFIQPTASFNYQKNTHSEIFCQIVLSQNDILQQKSCHQSMYQFSIVQSRNLIVPFLSIQMLKPDIRPSKGQIISKANFEVFI